MMETITYPTETTSIKEHRCDFCSEKISKGEKYHKSTHKNDGDFYTWKSHKYCSDLAARLKMYDAADEGMVTQEFFMETICEEHYSLLTKRFAENERIQYSEILQQLKCVRWHDKLWFVIRHYAKIEKEKQLTFAKNS